MVCSGLRVEWAEEDQKRGNVVIVPPEIYAKGCVHDVDEGLAVSSMFLFTAHSNYAYFDDYSVFCLFSGS